MHFSRRAPLCRTLVLFLRRTANRGLRGLYRIELRAHPGQLRLRRREFPPERLELLAVAHAVEPLTHDVPEIRPLLRRESTPYQLGERLIGGRDVRALKFRCGLAHPRVRLC